MEKGLSQKLSQLCRQDSNLRVVQSLLNMVPSNQRTAAVNGRIEVVAYIRNCIDQH